MKIQMSRLRKIIRDTINEISTPGDDRYDAYVPGTAKGGHSGVGRAYRKPSFPGFDDDTPTSYIDLDGNVHSSRDDMDDANYRIRNRGKKNQQGLGGPGGSYVQGVGWVPGDAQDTGDMADMQMSSQSDAASEVDKDGGNRNPKDFIIVIDSPVTRGRGGKIEAPQLRKNLTVKEETGSGTLAGDLKNNFQKPSFMNNRSKDTSMDIVRILEDHDILKKGYIDEIGIRTPSNGTVYAIEDYFAAYKNRFITECKKRVRLEKARRKNIL